MFPSLVAFDENIVRAGSCVRQCSPLALQKRKLLRSAQDLGDRCRFSNTGLVSPLSIVAFLKELILLFFYMRGAFTRQLAIGGSC